MPTIHSTITGVVSAIQAAPGQRIAIDDEVVILESMKMEIPVVAEVAGTVREVLVVQGAVVQEGDPLLVLD